MEFVLRIWRWFGENSTSLKGLASAVVIFGAVAAIPTLAWKVFQPDLVIYMKLDPGALPSDVLTSIDKIQEELRMTLKDKPNLPSLEKLRKFRSAFAYTDGISSLQLRILNQTDQTISGVKLRLTGVLEVWSITIFGSFLTEKESGNFVSSIEPVKDISNYVLPELPSLPPKGDLRIVLYGRIRPLFSQPKVEASAQGITSRIVETVNVEDSWIIFLYQNPLFLLPLLSSLLLIFFLFMPVIASFFSKRRRKIIASATPSIIYDLACKEALEGNADQAMFLLKKAFEKGYTNKVHVRNDPDLVTLQDRKDFKKLMGT